MIATPDSAETAGTHWVIRPIVTEDFGRWVVLWQGYLDFHRAQLSTSTSRQTFDRLCAQSDDMFGFVAERGDSLVGLAHGLLHPTTWSARPSCYLEDLFADPSARGTGAARALIDAIARDARRRGAEKIYWHTQEFNAPARSLYDRVANRMSWVVYARDLPENSG